MMHLKQFVASVLVSCLFAPTSLADQIVLLNGDRISGEIAPTQNSSVLTLKSSYGELEIPWTQIVSIYDTQGQPIEVEQPPVTTQSEGESQILQVTRDSSEFELPITASIIDDINNDADLTLGEKQTEDEEQDLSTLAALTSSDIKWSGGLNLGAQLRRGNADQERLNIDGEVTLRRPKDRLTIYGEINQNENEDQVTEDDRQLEFNYDYFLGGKWFLQGRLDFEQDDVAQLDLRTIAQTSLGYQFYESDPLNLKITTGVNVQREEFATEPEPDENIGIAWSLDYDQVFWDQITFFHNHDITTPFDDVGAFLFESKTGIKTPFLGFLTSTAEIDFDFDNDPADGARSADTIYRLKLGYEW